MSASQNEQTQESDINGSEKSFLGFLSSLCHDIRTPVSVIQGYSELLKEQLETAEDREAAETIYKNGQQLLTLLSKLGDLADAGTGSLIPFVSACSPQKIMRESIADVEQLAVVNEVQIQVQFDSQLPECVQVDKRRLKQILQQVLQQGVRLASLGKVICQTTSTPIDEQNALLTCEFSIPQLTDTFTFVDHEDSSIGFLPSAADSVSMLLARKLVERLGGQFEYLSEEASCITVRFSVPVSLTPTGSCQESGSHTTESLEQTTTIKKNLLRNCRVLIVEDHIDNQKLLSFICERAGATTNSVCNGMIALGELLAADLMQDPYDIILMDIDMPVMDGYEATRRIREIMDIPVIAITAHTMQGDREKCIEAGCNDYLAKPIDRQLLVETMTRLVHQKTSRHSFENVTLTES